MVATMAWEVTVLRELFSIALAFGCLWLGVEALRRIGAEGRRRRSRMLTRGLIALVAWGFARLVLAAMVMLGSTARGAIKVDLALGSNLHQMASLASFLVFGGACLLILGGVCRLFYDGRQPAGHSAATRRATR